MNVKNKVLFVILICLILITLYQVADTLALFQTDKTITVGNDIAEWNIAINNSNINNSNSFLINTVNWESSAYVKEGRVAPGISGYFDIVIDPSDTDVSIRYDITFDFTNLSPGEFDIGNITEQVNNSLVQTDEHTYTGIITLAEINDDVINRVRVSIEWLNNDINNNADSTLGSIPNNSISIPVTVNVTQYFGEAIVAY